MHSLIKLIYAALIAGSVVAFVSLSIYSFYQPPKYPDYPTYSGVDQTKYDQQQKQFNDKVDAYNKKDKNYQRNVTYIALPAAVVITVLGLLVFRRIDVIGEGVTLGGFGTSIYAVTTASIAGSAPLRFIALLVLMASVLAAAWRRFAGNGKSLPPAA